MVPIIPVLGRLEQEDHRFKDNLSYMLRSCQINKKPRWLSR